VFKLIEIKVFGCKLKDINEFQNFQGNLKELPEIQKNKLKESITRNGFNAPIFTWKGNNYILDGHQRIIAVKELIKEGQEHKDIFEFNKIISMWNTQNRKHRSKVTDLKFIDYLKNNWNIKNSTNPAVFFKNLKPIKKNGKIYYKYKSD